MVLENVGLNKKIKKNGAESLGGSIAATVQSAKDVKALSAGSDAVAIRQLLAEPVAGQSLADWAEGCLPKRSARKPVPQVVELISQKLDELKRLVGEGGERHLLTRTQQMQHWQ